MERKNQGWNSPSASVRDEYTGAVFYALTLNSQTRLARNYEGAQLQILAKGHNSLPCTRVWEIRCGYLVQMGAGFEGGAFNSAHNRALPVLWQSIDEVLSTHFSQINLSNKGRPICIYYERVVHPISLWGCTSLRARSESAGEIRSYINTPVSVLVGACPSTRPSLADWSA